MDDIKLKILVFTGIGLFSAASIGVFLGVLKLTLMFLPEVSVMGIAMYAVVE